MSTYFSYIEYSIEFQLATILFEYLAWREHTAFVHSPTDYPVVLLDMLELPLVTNPSQRFEKAAILNLIRQKYQQPPCKMYTIEQIIILVANSFYHLPCAHRAYSETSVTQHKPRTVSTGLGRSKTVRQPSSAAARSSPAGLG